MILDMNMLGVGARETFDALKTIDDEVKVISQMVSHLIGRVVLFCNMAVSGLSRNLLIYSSRGENKTGT